MDEIKKVDVSIIAKFDEFAKKHNEIPTWQVVVTGELELELYDEEED